MRYKKYVLMLALFGLATIVFGLSRLCPLSLAALFVLGAGIAAYRAREDWGRGVLRLATGHFAAALVLATAGAASLSWKYSGAVVLPELEEALAAADAPVYAFRTYDWTLPVYTGRMLVPVQWRGELDYGLDFEPTKGIAEFDEFARRWTSAPQSYLIVEPGQLAALGTAGLPYHVLKSSPELVLLSRR